MKEQNFKDAESSFEAAFAIAPDNRVYRDALAEARFWASMQAAESALKDNRTEDALSEFDKARSLRPKNVDAVYGYAGALMQRGDNAAALPILERVTKMDATRAQAWMDLIRAKEAAVGPEQAIEIVKTMPAAVATRLNSDLEHLSLLAGLYLRAGDQTSAKKTFEHATAIAAKTSSELPVSVETQMAALYVEFGQPAAAIKLFRSAVNRNPENLEAWEGLLLASNRGGEAGPALKALEALPPSVHEAAQQRPGFLRAVAAVEASVGNLSSAEAMLTRAREIEITAGREASFATVLQTAQVWLEAGKNGEAAKVFELLTRSHGNNVEAWKGLILSLHKQGAYQQAAEAMRNIPDEPAATLSGDAGYVAVAAAVYKETGNTEDALVFLRKATEQFVAEGKSVPPALTVQLGWMLLDVPGRERELFVLLRNARSRNDLPVKDRKAVEEIWTAWLLRSSDAAKTQGNMQEAIAILEAGVRMMPSDPRLRRSLAGAFLSNADPKRAFAIYKATGLKGATASEYLSAVGAGIAAHEARMADAWLKEGLLKYPGDTELLCLAGKQAAARNDFKKAEAFWRVALQGLDAHDKEIMAERLRSGPDGIDNFKSGNPTDDVGIALLSRSDPSSAHKEPASQIVEYRLPWSTTKSSGMTSVIPVVSSSPGDKLKPESTRNTEALVAELLASHPETRAAVSGSTRRPDQPVLTSSLAGVAPRV